MRGDSVQQRDEIVEYERCRKELEAVRERFRREAARGPGRWRFALLELADALFERGLCLSALRRRHRLGSLRQSEKFRREYGESLRTYVSRWRRETGQRLLEVTELHRWQVATAVGYASGNSLGVARRREQRSGSTGADAEAPERTNPTCTTRVGQRERQYRQVLCLGVGPGTSAEIEERLREIHKLGAGRTVFAVKPLAERAAEAWWERLRVLPFEEARREVQGGFPPATLALFHRLLRESREEGRDDRRRGVGLAILALESLVGARPAVSPVEHSRLHAQAWMVLGNAHRLALDYPAAEEAFANAAILLSEPAAPMALRAELASLRCDLRRYQRRISEALAFAEEAVALSEGDAGSAAKALLLRGGVWWHLRELERAAADYRAALAALGPEPEAFLELTTVLNLAAALFELGEYGETREHLERAKQLATKLDQRGPICHTQWVEGMLLSRVESAAAGETHLHTARQGLRELGEMGHFAVISLDLAGVLAGAGKPDACLAILAEALPHLEALRLEGEGLVALKLLSQAVGERQIRLDLVEKVRSSAQQLPDTRPTKGCAEDRHPA